MSTEATRTVAHSPGPWYGGKERQRDITYAIRQNGYRIVSVHRRDVMCPPFTPDAEQAANANLIAAAPDLLTALKDVLRLVDLQGQPRIVQIAQDAIAKAEGRS